MNLMNKPMLATAQQLEEAFYFDFKPTLNHYTIGSMAIIPIEGLLFHRFSGFGTSYEGIRIQLEKALHDSAIESIVLDIDSGGGEVSGLLDLADFIFEARNEKPITALVNENAYSAAYLLAASASQIIAPKTAGVGSVGVIVAHLDQSEAEKKVGLKVTEIYAGKHKVDFSPHQPLSEQAKSEVQNQVDETYELLLQTLARNRQVSAEVFRGTEAKTYLASQALELNLIDQIQSPYKFLKEHMMAEGTQQVADTPDLTQLLSEERARIKVIMQMCKMANMPNYAETLIEAGHSIDSARKILFEELANNTADITNALPERENTSNQLVQSMVRGLGGKLYA